MAVSSTTDTSSFNVINVSGLELPHFVQEDGNDHVVAQHDSARYCMCCMRSKEDEVVLRLRLGS